MNLPSLAIKNHQFTLILIGVLVFAGAAAFLTMPRSEDPAVAPLGATVTAIYPGAGPADMEQLVVDPVEKKLNELSGIKRINGVGGNGYAEIAVEFEGGTDMDDRYAQIVQKVGSIRGELPKDLMSLEVTRWILSDFVIILQLGLVSESESFERLDRELDVLEKRLRRVAGVKKIKRWAATDREVRVDVDAEKLRSCGIALKDVMAAVQASNMNIPGGYLDLGTKRFNVKTTGTYVSLDDIRKTVIRAAPGHVLRLGDVADVRFTDADEDYRARVNGKRAVFLTVNQKEKTNIFGVMKGIRLAVAEFEKKLPPSIDVVYVFDQSKSVAFRLNGFFQSLLLGLFLVGGIILLFEGARASLIVMTALPVSVFIGIFFVSIFGYSLEQMTIAGLVIVLGMLVDNAIVVTQNTGRFIREGRAPREAAASATQQIAWALVSSTLTTVFAFLPIIMMRDTTGEYIRSMPLTVVFTLLVSLVLALTMTPYLSGVLLARARSRSTILYGVITKFTEGPYRRILEKAIRRPLRVVAAAGATFLLSLGLFPIIGVSYFPKAEKPQFIINVDLPEGANLDKTDEAARHVEAILDARQEIRTYAVNIGRGNPQIHYNVESKEYNIAHAQFYVEVDKNDQIMLGRLIENLRSDFRGYPGARIEVKEIEQGPDVEAPVAIKILGDELDVLADLAGKTEAVFNAVPGLLNIRNPLKDKAMDLVVRLDRSKAGAYGVLTGEADMTVRACVAGIPVSKYRRADGKEFDIVVRLAREPVDDGKGVPQSMDGSYGTGARRRRFRPSDFDRIDVPSITGALVPLKQIADISLAVSPKQISHYNFEREATITADVMSGYNVDRVTNAVVERLSALEWPKGYSFHISGQQESREESFGGMGRAAVIAVLAILALLVLEFKSIAQPLIVFSTLPLAIVGSLFGLFISGNSFSFTAFIGLTALFGIVVNNSILLIDYTNMLHRNQGLPLDEAISKACRTRFMPVFMTSITTILGLLPLLLTKSTLWAPLSWTMMGGLALSTMLTMLVTPSLYKLFTRNGRNKGGLSDREN